MQPRGFTFAGAAAGIKKEGLDLGLIFSERTAAAAAVFTKSRRSGWLLFAVGPMRTRS